MPGFNTIPATGGGGGQANMTYVASIHMETYNRSWAQGGTAGYYAVYSTNQENGYAYFVGATTTGVPLNRLANITHSFTRIDVIAPTNDMLSLYKAKVKATTVFENALSGFASFPSIITSSGNFVLPNNALPLVNVLIVGGGGGCHNHSGGGGGGGVVKLTAYQAVGTTSVTVGTTPGNNATNSPGGASYFGNVYALGGAGGPGVNEVSSPGANGAGGGNHSNPGSQTNYSLGITQTSSTGLGTSGSPVYQGGFRGGYNYQPSHTGRHMGGGGGGAGGNGQDRNNFTGGTTGGAGHGSDITGSTRYYGSGGGGADHDGQYQGSYSTERYIGAGANSGHNSSHNTSGHTGGVVVRYYIP
jgi:hypothetical protein